MKCGCLNLKQLVKVKKAFFALVLIVFASNIQAETKLIFVEDNDSIMKTLDFLGNKIRKSLNESIDILEFPTVEMAWPMIQTDQEVEMVLVLDNDLGTKGGIETGLHLVQWIRSFDFKIPPFIIAHSATENADMMSAHADDCAEKSKLRILENKITIGIQAVHKRHEDFIKQHQL